MPLVRFQVRNEYGLGQPQLYKVANKEDPKAVLDGVAVAGLVGILRQLGDLAEFAAEVFHGLQEHVTTTASRSHKLMVRVQHIEAALPPLEKAVLAQTSHIHFAYTAGVEWHPRIRNESHHFIYNDLPRFIMDSYEECSDPPRLHLLDKFDTGGPGSCLKRYSDPTFFKRASALPDEANIEKRQRERKVQRSKKKKGSQHNGDISRCASVSNRSSRMQPISYIVNGQSSPSPTASTTDMALKSDLGNHCNSFGSRTVSGYIEYVAHSGSSMQARQQEYKESCSSESVLHDDTLESVLPDGRSVFVDGNSPGSSLQDQVTSSSSCGKWDEKAEIVDPTGQQRCFIETIEILPAMNDMDSHEGGAGDIRSIEPKDFLFHDENILEPTLSRIPLDEFESEADAFMDALNTIESESEYDLDYQTKREVGNFPTFDDSKGRDAMHEITMDSSSPQTPRFEHTATTYISPERDMPVDQPNSASLESHFREQIPQLATVPSISNHPVGGDRIDVIDDSRLETENCDSTSSGSGNVNAQDKVVSSLCEPQDSPAEILSNNSINFWTNGGMLGLEPSKPPDFTMASPVNPASRSTGETFCLSNHAYKIIVDEHDMEPSMLTVDDRCNHKDQEDGISSENISEGVSPTEVSTKLGSIGDSCKSNRFGPAMDDGWRKIKTIAPGNAVPVAAYNKSTSNDLNQQNDESTSRVFGLGRRLLENGFGRSVPDAFDNNFKPVSYLDAGAFEQRNEPHRSFPGAAFRENSEDGFGVHSSPASPPLEHMKISFHPINGIETSKLQLKLSDGNQSHGSVRDMFQSFQLIPEPAIPLHEFGSDSDDDTFCRSSPYISDDCVSHHSESNSEQWESSGTPEKENHELYDALRGISSVEHTSRSPELGEIANSAIYTDGAINSVYSENGLVQYLSDPLLDLPSLDAFKPVLLQEPKDVSTPKGLHGLRSLDAFEPVLLQEPKDVSTLKDLDGLRCLEAFNPVLLQEPKDVSTPKDFHGLRSLDDFKPVQLQEPKDVSTPKDLQNLRCPGESTPRPPPLPPVEWRLLKPHLDATEENHNVSESFKPVPDTGLWASFTFQQQPLKRLEVNEHPASMKPVLKQQNQQKKEHKGANETAVNSKEIDEKDDFLQQIRTQSFNLRRTVTAKARNTTAGPATHVKVTAILEKANAIRQAVGSDDGDDDDTWSET